MFNFVEDFIIQPAEGTKRHASQVLQGRQINSQTDKKSVVPAELCCAHWREIVVWDCCFENLHRLSISRSLLDCKDTKLSFVLVNTVCDFIVIFANWDPVFDTKKSFDKFNIFGMKMFRKEKLLFGHEIALLQYIPDFCLCFSEFNFIVQKKRESSSCFFRKTGQKIE